MELFDVASGNWIQATEAEDWQDADRWPHLTPEQAKEVKGRIGSGSGSNVQSPKGRPLTRATYGMHVWFPEEKAFYNTIYDLWAFSPDRREWKQINPDVLHGHNTVHAWGVSYDPELKTILEVVTAGPQKGIHVYDRQKNSWTKKWDSPDGGMVYATYDSARKVHLIHAGVRGRPGVQSTYCTLNTATGQITPIKDLEEARRAKGKTPVTYGDYLQSISIEYDPENELTFAMVLNADPKEYSGRNPATELWAYDADTDDWFEVALEGTPPAGPPLWDHLVYDLVDKCLLFVNVPSVTGGKVDGVFAFRYKPADAVNKKR